MPVAKVRHDPCELVIPVEAENHRVGASRPGFLRLRAEAVGKLNRLVRERADVWPQNIWAVGDQERPLYAFRRPGTFAGDGEPEANVVGNIAPLWNSERDF